MSVTINIDLPYDAILTALKGTTFGLFEAQSVHKNYFQAMPYLTGNYCTLIDFQPFEYTHLAPYSDMVYDLNRNYRKDTHPFAMSQYIEGYQAVAMPKVERELQNYINARIL